MNFMKLTALLLLVTVASPAFAYYRVDRDDLDDDIVEKIPVPVLFGVDYEDINPDYADPRDGGSRSHEGEDMLAPKGTPIVSPTEAIVIKTGTGPSSGKYVYTANPGGETFRYMHLDTIGKIDEGDELEVGDFIGTVGDTGNAPDGVYHLHFEIRNEDNDPVDPYLRLDEDGFTLKEKVSFLRDVFRNVSNDDDYAEFLVTTFRDDFRLAFNKKYNLPSVIDDVLEDHGLVDEEKALQSLTTLIKSLPAALDMTLQEGDQGATVTVLQLYLIYGTEGAARNVLRNAGPTGYFGPITRNAVAEYQQENMTVNNKGVYDKATRIDMMKRSNLVLNLN